MVGDVYSAKLITILLLHRFLNENYEITEIILDRFQSSGNELKVRMMR